MVQLSRQKSQIFLLTTEPLYNHFHNGETFIKSSSSAEVSEDVKMHPVGMAVIVFAILYEYSCVRGSSTIIRS